MSNFRVQFENSLTFSSRVTLTSGPELVVARVFLPPRSRLAVNIGVVAVVLHS